MTMEPQSSLWVRGFDHLTLENEDAGFTSFDS